MPGYDSWKTRAPDLDGPEEPSLEQQRADYEDEMQQIENVGNNAAVPDGDVRWAVNVLLEKIAAKFEAWETMDLFRSDAASTVRGFKHDLTFDAAQAVVERATEEACRRFSDEVEQYSQAHIDELASLGVQAHPAGKITVDRGNLRYAFIEGARFAAQPPAAPVETGAKMDGIVTKSVLAAEVRQEELATRNTAALLAQRVEGPRLSAETSDDLVERLRNPMWAHGNVPFESPQLEQDENIAAMNEAAAEIERLRIDHDNRSKLNHARAKIIEECMDMLADVPGDGLIAKLTEYIGSYMALQIKVSGLPHPSAGVLSEPERDQLATRFLMQAMDCDEAQVQKWAKDFDRKWLATIGFIVKHVTNEPQEAPKPVSVREVSSLLAEYFPGKQRLRDQCAEAILALSRPERATASAPDASTPAQRPRE